MSVDPRPNPGSSLDLADILERHTTISYGEHVRARWAVKDVPALVAEIEHLQAVVRLLYGAHSQTVMDTEHDEDVRMRVLASALAACPWLEESFDAGGAA